MIFPKVRGYIDPEVICFIAQAEHQVNPAPVILAETSRSLNHCRITGEGTMDSYAPKPDR